MQRSQAKSQQENKIAVFLSPWQSQATVTELYQHHNSSQLLTKVLVFAGLIHGRHTVIRIALDFNFE